MAKLDPVKVRYIIRQKNLGRNIKEIITEMKVSGRWIQKLYVRYCKTGEIQSPNKPGRPKAVITGRMRKMVSIYVKQYQIGVVVIDKELDRWRIHIPHNTICRIMREWGLATCQSKKSRRRK